MLYIPYPILFRRRCRSLGRYDLASPSVAKYWLDLSKQDESLSYLQAQIRDNYVHNLEKGLSNSYSLKELFEKYYLGKPQICFLEIAILCRQGHYTDALAKAKNCQKSLDMTLYHGELCVLKAYATERNGDMQSAVDILQKALKFFEKIKNSVGIVDVLCNFGVVHEKMRFFDKARDKCLRSLNLANEIGYKEGMIRVNNNLGLVYEKKNLFNKAIEHYQNAVTLAEDNGYSEAVASLKNNLGIVNQVLGNLDDALLYYKSAGEIDESNSNWSGVLKSHASTGAVYHSLYQRTQNPADLFKSKNEYSFVLENTLDLSKSPTIQATLFKQVGDVYFELEDYDKSIKFYNDAYNISKLVKGWEWKTRLLYIEKSLLSAWINSKDSNYLQASYFYSDAANCLFELGFNATAQYYQCLKYACDADNALAQERIGQAIDLLETSLSVIDGLCKGSENAGEEQIAPEQIVSLAQIQKAFLLYRRGLTYAYHFSVEFNYAKVLEELQHALASIARIHDDDYYNKRISANRTHLKALVEYYKAEECTIETGDLAQALLLYPKSLTLLAETITFYRQLKFNIIAKELEAEHWIISARFHNLKGDKEQAMAYLEKAKRYYSKMGRNKILNKINLFFETLDSTTVLNTPSMGSVGLAPTDEQLFFLLEALAKHLAVLTNYDNGSLTLGKEDELSAQFSLSENFPIDRLILSIEPDENLIVSDTMFTIQRGLSKRIRFLFCPKSIGVYKPTFRISASLREEKYPIKNIHFDKITVTDAIQIKGEVTFSQLPQRVYANRETTFILDINFTKPLYQDTMFDIIFGEINEKVHAQKGQQSLSVILTYIFPKAAKYVRNVKLLTNGRMLGESKSITIQAKESPKSFIEVMSITSGIIGFLLTIAQFLLEHLQFTASVSITKYWLIVIPTGFAAAFMIAILYWWIQNRISRK